MLPKPRNTSTLAFWSMRFDGLGIALLVFAGRRSRRFRKTFLAILFPLLLGGSLLISGCGSGSNAAGTGTTTTVTKTTVDGTPAGNYTLTITGASGKLQHSTSITMQVQ